MIDDVTITPLRSIPVPGGNVLHAMKGSDTGYAGFGEAYFSVIEHGSIKAWKRHQEMQLNLIVPIGEVRFVLFDDRGKTENEKFQEVILSRQNYCRLTVPPMIWLGFQGVAIEDSILLNIADIEHSPQEVDRKSINKISFEWRVN